MNTPKEAVAEIIRDLPDAATYDDIMYHLYVLSRIERGLIDAEEGRLISQEEVEKYMRRWITGENAYLDSRSSREYRDGD